VNQQAAAIIIAGALIAAAIALTNHWELRVAGDSNTLLLNRWTGTITICGGVKQPGWETTCPPTFPTQQQPAK
jgi:hypothetical protein